MLWEQQLRAFAYSALPAIPSQLQRWEITDEAGCAGWPRLSDFFMIIQGIQLCVKGSYGLDPAGIRSLLPVQRLPQIRSENLVSFLLGKLGLMYSCAPLLSSWFCKICFEFFTEHCFLLYIHLFLEDSFATIPIRGPHPVCLLKLFPESQFFWKRITSIYL